MTRNPAQLLLIDHRRKICMPLMMNRRKALTTPAVAGGSEPSALKMTEADFGAEA
jgi:hypothetical protein